MDVSSPNLAYNLLRVDVAAVAREVSQKLPQKANEFAPGSINCSTTFLLMCQSTLCGEPGLLLHMFRLPERPKQDL